MQGIKRKVRCTEAPHILQGGVYENGFLNKARAKVRENMNQIREPVTMAQTVKALYKKLADMQQHLRITRDRLKDGDAIQLRVNVKPRGPRGIPGKPGFIGPSGLMGAVGGRGAPGNK